MKVADLEEVVNNIKPFGLDESESVKSLLRLDDAKVFEPILMAQHKAIISLVDNDWICNCQLKSLAELYKDYSLQFMHVLYCKGPHHLYGAALDEVDFELEDCVIASTSHETNDTITIKEPNNLRPKPTTEYPDSNTLLPVKLNMRCFDEEHFSYFEQPTADFKHQSRSANDRGLSVEFPAPDFEFELELIIHNNSVSVTIANPVKLILSFGLEQQESADINNVDKISTMSACAIMHQT
ncbi:hypothetical protein EVAR_73489_1 [Eumeta japonica]|uniref:Uncharacterized protein n=1 Tax=Eumeta variegata TaxID=151549 RepID=A0A4C1T8L3_EUMVA|nr:hypothetical protein EVAR_73489_1 [Eumeta japonica]